MRHGAKVIVNLVDQALLPNEAKGNFFSVVDIDVIRVLSDLESVEALASVIDDLHGIEKDVFVALLEPSFLQSLHPEFE